MPLKKDVEKLENKKSDRNITKKTNASSKKESITAKVQNTKKNTSQYCKSYINHIIITLLILNLIIWIILICKLNKIQNRTILGNWWEDNFELLQWIYKSDKYKTYIHNEILDLENQLNEKESN